MSNLVGYQKWLAKQQRDPVFINNFWCALLAYNMEDNELAGSFKILNFIVEEELTKEDNNFLLENNKIAYTSNVLRHWLIHLLKSYNGDVNVINYEQVLRAFLVNQGLPINCSCPLSTSSSFHNLPSECKIWILHNLISYQKAAQSIREITKDALGNAYFIAPGCRIYVRLARPADYFNPIDEAQVRGQPWETLYRFLTAQPCLLLCENRNEWEAVKMAFQSFGMNNLLYSIHPEMLVQIHRQNQTIMMRDEQRKEFGKIMQKLLPIPKARTTKKIMNQSEIETAVGNTASALRNYIEAVSLDESAPQPTQREANPKKKSKELLGKCWNFPQCPLQDRCKYLHPRNPCTKFPNCPRGWQCLFLHEFCPNDADCVEPNCAYEHTHSISTYYRMPREPEVTNPRPIAAVPPIVRTDQTVTKPTETSSVVNTPACATAVKKERKRCQYFPQCNNRDNCRYIHPTLMCKKQAAGMKCPGRWCLSLHGACPNDEKACNDVKCIYEHYKSKPIIVRKQTGPKKQQPLTRAPSTTNLSRAKSTSNVSLSSARSGRRKSVTFDDDSDCESVASHTSRKESTDTKPAGILRPAGFNSMGRCKFAHQCTNKICEYTHPTVKCPAFPRCPNGGDCIFLHDKCENDGVCCKDDCDFEHYRPRNISTDWCKNGSRCKRVNCKFIHPKECVGICPTPGDCWMYHRPGNAPRRPDHPPQGGVPSLLQQPHHAPWPAPGYHQPPHFAHHGSHPYGFGPNYPQGPGYGYPPSMGPGGYYGPAFPPQGPGYWQGPEPGYAGPNGSYRPRPDYGAGSGYASGPGGPRSEPPVPPRPSTVPNSYSNLSAEKRDQLERKSREAEDRFRGEDFTRL